MRAAQVVTPTGPAAVEIREVDEPAPGPDDVLVEVHRVGDCLSPRGLLAATADGHRVGNSI